MHRPLYIMLELVDCLRDLLTTTRVVAAISKHSRFETMYNIYRHRGSSNNDPNNNTATELPSSVMYIV